MLPIKLNFIKNNSEFNNLITHELIWKFYLQKEFHIQFQPQKFHEKMELIMNKYFFGFLLAILLNINLTAQENDSYEELSKTSADVGENYFKAYIAMDWNSLESMLDVNATFRDPTAEKVFGGSIHKGKEAVMKYFMDNYSAIQEISFIELRKIISGNYVIFEGDLDWTLKIEGGKEVRSVMPIATILMIENGKVKEHKDFADYHPFLKEYRRVKNTD